ncbi:HAMP domain-containing sensor histidine kinase [Amycolatopsis alkalitolerans]|uniref:histidine kinase n=1 Tax=Amycolatopsis alkalitolerans TaxID=2547244 RepID=A0A5C4M042_9PSEU|nr:ATP-binding protein [Amycolatopsis alkalitolerans]TNC24139.1 HAMP domain-containing protein [Amycolatopsis alkalitolerans]
MRVRKRFGALRWRLFAAFLAVAVSAVALLALLAAVSVDQRSALLAEQQQGQLRNEIASALAAAYVAGSGSWRPQDLAVVNALATSGDASVVVADDRGREVARMGPGTHGPAHDPDGTGHSGGGGTPEGTPEPVAASTAIPIVVDGRQVGTAQLTLPATEPVPVAAARTALLQRVGLGALAGVLLAAVAAAVVSRRMSRPLLALAGATRAFAAGDLDAGTRLRPAPGELGEVGAAFTEMAATVRRQDELRRAVVADVAHELRTPVTILRGQTEQLLDGIAEPTEQHLVSLHDEVLRLGRLTDDLATLSAADAAGLALHTGPVDLGTLTREATEAMRAQFTDAGLAVHVEAATGIEVLGDGARITQIVTNLLTNAVKFTPSGGRVTVTAGREGADAVLTVTDTGPGIDEEELPHVFERFWRGRAAGGRSGSGIGLAVVRALVEAHRGTVTAARPAEGGACFTVRLPAGERRSLDPGHHADRGEAGE